MFSFVTSPLPTSRLQISRQFKCRPIVRCNRFATCATLVPLSTGLKMEVIQLPAQFVTPSTTASKPPLVFVHGSLHAAWTYQLFQQYFSQLGYDTHSISLRGAGNSEIDQTTSVTLAEHCADLTAFFNSANFSSAPVIVAHSIGGFLIQKWLVATAAPSIAALVLMASTPPTGNSPIVWRTLRRRGLMFSWRLTMGFVKRNAAKDVDVCREMFFSPKDAAPFDEDLEGDAKLTQYMSNFAKTKLTLDPSALRDPIKHAVQLPAPILVIGGTSDSLVDVDALQHTAQFWNADLIQVPDAPHDLMLYSGWRNVAETVETWISNATSQNS